MIFTSRLPACLGLGLSLVTISCTSKMGPKLIEKSFTNYGEAIHSVVREELLLNVVRRHYHESPQFVSLQSISHTRSVSSTLAVGTNVNPSGFSLATGQAGAESIDYPTFTISPQQGPEIAEKLHQRMPLKMLPQLTSTGYPTELVLTLLAEEIGGVAGVEAGAHDSFRPGCPKFVSILNAVKELECTRQIKLDNALWEIPAFEHPFAAEVFTPSEVVKSNEGGNRYTSTDEGKSFYVNSEKIYPSLWIDPKARHSGAGRDFLRLLDLNPDTASKAWILKEVRYSRGDTSQDADKDSITVRTRSFYGVLNLLSHGLDVPECGPNACSSSKDGYVSAVKEGLAPDIASRFTIHFSCKAPDCPFLAVQSQRGWFYIEQKDYSTQQIFNMLSDLYNLQIGTETKDGNSIPTPPPLSISAR